MWIMDMNSVELKAFAELVADIVECRLRSPAAAEVRRLQLRDDIVAVSDQNSNITEVVRGARRVLHDHDIDGIGAKIDQTREREPRPPDDLYEELKRLEKKLRGLMNEDAYERKLIWRHQISLADLTSILVEILSILRKLYGRTLPQPQG
jgi:hypothetical protein